MAYSFDQWQAGEVPPKGWDCADACDDGWTKENLDAFMKASVRPWTPPAKKSTDKPAERVERPAAPVSSASAGKPVAEARTTQQEKPEAATVTDIKTRKTISANDSWMMDLVCNEEGKVKPGATKNWALFLEHHKDMQGVFAWDAFKLRVMLVDCPPWCDATKWTSRGIQDRDYSEAVMWLEARHMTPKASNIAAVIQTVAEHSSFDRLSDYLGGLKWDGAKRVENWLTYYLGIEDAPYSRTVGRGWLISSVARGLKPGCKVDTMPILEGPQGAQKSTAVRALYGDEFFTDGLSDIGSKDAKMEMQGVWGLEVAEMQKFNAAETNEVKKFLTQQVDRFRPPYGRSIIEAHRRCVLVGTINPEGNPYLKDATGARRFWPLTVGRIDIEAIRADRDQLWAEAVHMFRAGTPWWVQQDEQDAVEIEQEKRTDVDVWVDLIVPMLAGNKTILQTDIFKGLGIPSKDADWRHAGRVGRIMKKLGWIVGRDRKGGEDRAIFTNPRYTETAETTGELSETW